MSLRLLLLAAVLLAPAAGARTILDAGVAALEADLDSTPRCTLGVDAELCVLVYDDAGTAEPGDDEFAVVKAMEEVRVVLRPPVGEPLDESFVLDPGDWYVPNPAFARLNATWQQLNQSLPGEARQFLTLESREMEMVPGNWGLWALVHLPVDAQDPVRNYPVSPTYVGVLCWSLVCGMTTDGYLMSDDQGIRPARDSVLLVPHGSDELLEQTVLGDRGVLECGPWMSEATCSSMLAARAAARPFVGLAEALTPAATLGFRFDRAAVAVMSPAAALASAGGGPSLGVTMEHSPGGIPSSFDPDDAPPHSESRCRG